MLVENLFAEQTPASTEEQPRKGNPKPFNFKVALVGCGRQGRSLLNDMLKIPGLQIAAICDIWEHARKYAFKIVRRVSNETQMPRVYTEYVDMLATEKEIDAVVVATPDWMHSPITCAALKTGKHVYCEALMSSTVEGARAMVLAARSSGKLLQIGHHRRSNPRYQYARENLRHLGGMSTIFAQLSMTLRDLEVPSEGICPCQDALRKYGYDNMDCFYNWRWFSKFCGGPLVDVSAHQIDTLNWLLQKTPHAITAFSAKDYYTGRQWPDYVLAVYEYHGPSGKIRAVYQLSNTENNFEHYEIFTGQWGSLQFSEHPWYDKDVVLRVGPSVVQRIKKPDALDKPAALYHLENFFQAIRDGVELNCPGEVAFETVVAALRVNNAIAEGHRIEFNRRDFVI